MQTLLAFLPVAQVAPNGNPVNAILDQLRQQSQVDTRTWLISFVLCQVIAIIAILIASKTVVAERFRDTFRNALRVWITHWVIAIIALIVAAVLVYALAAVNAQLAGIAFLVITLITLALFIRVPMRVYQIGFFRSIGLLILAWVVTLLGSIGVSFILGPSPTKQWALIQQIQRLTPEQRTELSNAIKGKQGAPNAQLLPGEAEARDRSKPLLERAEALKTMYAELEKRRQAVQPDDENAKATYERQKARYEALLDQLKAEAHAQQQQGTAKSQ